MSSNSPDFSGRLVYYVCRTRGAPADEILDALVAANRFDDRERAGEAKTGFEPLSFEPDDGYAGEGFPSVDEGVYGLRFRSEKFGEVTEVYDSEADQRITAQPITEDSADLLTMSPETLLVRSSKRTYSHVNDVIQSQEPAGGRISQLSFDPDFMLWLFWQYYTGQHLSELEPLSLSGAEFVGERSAFGQQTRITGSSDISNSTPILTGLLSGQDIDMLRGKFEYQGEFVEMELTREGRVHVKATGHITELPMPERVLYGCDVVHKTVEAYNQWENRPLSSKYPPAEFFTSMVETLSEQDVEIDYSMDHVFEEYAEKRGEEFEEYVESIR